MLRVVLDTNVWISAWLWGGLPWKLIMMHQNQKIVIYSSAAILQELSATLKRPKFKARLELLNGSASAVVETTLSLVKLCSIACVDASELRDPNDIIIIGTAVAAEANAIITGDQDLLVLESYLSILILTPKQFIDQYSFSQ
ncbi:MAG: putative toxin-antitoxin system toxin component, PIN family [Chloroflexaceae bacterium]|nr:putative toxin-antitoxin system toxin component, PIN family [Chloroflexaceae bacterium]